MSTNEKPAKPSAVEGFKGDSNYLRGDIASELFDGNPNFGKGSIQLLKHHGTYEQDDRDRRAEARAAGHDKAYMFMVRTKIPGGRITGKQLLAELKAADELGNGTLRITSRQGLQLHRVLKDDLKDSIQRINDCGLTTLGACGDVNRNVMCCPAPFADAIHQGMRELADTLADHFAPRSSAYREIWLQDRDGQREMIASGADEAANDRVEPIYGKLYLPRKFKIGVALPEDNCIDVYTHDLGLIALHDGNQITGYNVLVGGGLGVTPSAKKTFPALAKKLCYVTPEQVVDVATAIVKVQRDHGNRSDRKVARLKYLIHRWGIEKFKSTVEQYYGGPLSAPTDEDIHDFDNHMGWSAQGDGKWFYGLNVENGRILDNEQMKLKTALREICSQFDVGVHFTAHQSALLTNIHEGDKTTVEEILTKHGVALSEQVSNVRQWSMACVAWPTCGLSITEAERALPAMTTQLEGELARMGLAVEEFTMRMTGCPNGCARPYNPDIGLVGKAKGKYTLFLGGHLLGNRLGFIYKDLVPEADVISEIVAVFEYFKLDRNDGESFGDFCHRKGKDDLIAWTESQTA